MFYMPHLLWMLATMPLSSELLTILVLNILTIVA